MRDGTVREREGEGRERERQSAPSGTTVGQDPGSRCQHYLFDTSRRRSVKICKRRHDIGRLVDNCLLSQIAEGCIDLLGETSLKA